MCTRPGRVYFLSKGVTNAKQGSGWDKKQIAAQTSDRGIYKCFPWRSNVPKGEARELIMSLSEVGDFLKESPARTKF